MTEPDVAIRIRALTKRYGDVEAIRGIELDVWASEIFGLIGPDGAGKSIGGTKAMLRESIGMSESFAALAARGLNGTTLGKALSRLEEQAPTDKEPGLCLYWIVPDQLDAPESEWLPERISRWWRVDLGGPSPAGGGLVMTVGLTAAELVARLREDPRYMQPAAGPVGKDAALANLNTRRQRS